MKTNNSLRSGRKPLRYVHSLLFKSLRGAVLAGLVALLPTAAQAQGWVEAWVQRYNGPGNAVDAASAITVDASGSLYVTGLSTGLGSGYDYATIKYSSAGLPLWTNRYNGPGNSHDYGRAVAVDASGNVIVAGVSSGSGSGLDFATIKYSSAGVPLWTNRYNGPGNGQEDRVALAVDGSGSVVLTGSSEGTPAAGSYDYATIKYSSSGEPLWTNRYNGPGDYWDTPLAVAEDTEGNVIVTGHSTGAGTSEDYATIKYSSTGEPLWTNRYAGPAYRDVAGAIAVDASGNIYVAGDSIGIDSGNDFLTIKYSSAGLPLWTRRYNGPANGDDLPAIMSVDASGNVVVTGRSPASASDNGWVTVAYSSAGAPLWTNRYTGPGDLFDGVEIALDAVGHLFVCGYAWTGSYMKFIALAYSSTGVPVWTNSTRVGQARAIAVDNNGSVYVTGTMQGPTSYDFGTVKYVPGGPPVITRQPLGWSNLVGTTASFAVEVAGGLPLSYQWREGETDLLDGGNISGVTTTNLLIANVQPADAGGYSVVITNAYGSVTSSVAQLTVTIPPNPGRFSNFAYSPTMGFSFVFRDGTVGKPYRIQRSPSMAEGSWVDWQSFTYTEPILFTDLGATGTERRFYRAVSP